MTSKAVSNSDYLPINSLEQSWKGNAISFRFKELWSLAVLPNRFLTRTYCNDSDFNSSIYIKFSSIPKSVEH